MCVDVKRDLSEIIESLHSRFEYYDLRNESILRVLNKAKLGTLSIMFDSQPVVFAFPFYFSAGTIHIYCAADIFEELNLAKNAQACFHVFGNSDYENPEAPCPSLSIYGTIYKQEDEDIESVYNLFGKKYESSPLLASPTSCSFMISLSVERIYGVGLLPE